MFSEYAFHTISSVKSQFHWERQKKTYFGTFYNPNIPDSLHMNPKREITLL